MLPFNLRLKTFYILIRICKTFCEWGIYKYAKYEISWGHMRKDFSLAKLAAVFLIWKLMNDTDLKNVIMLTNQQCFIGSKHSSVKHKIL